MKEDPYRKRTTRQKPAKGVGSDTKEGGLKASGSLRASKTTRGKSSVSEPGRRPGPRHPRPKAFPIVGIGASAGGLEAFIELLKHLPANTGMAFVLVQHLDPVHESALSQILSRATSMPVHEVTDRLAVEPNHVYVIPPNVRMQIADGVLRLHPRKNERRPHHSINIFFESLAADQHERAIGVILSGTATDGTQGLEAIKVEGGITFAQDQSAKYDSMPRNAAAAGCVDLVLAPKGIARELSRIASHPLVTRPDLVLKSEKDRENAQRQGPKSPLPSGGSGTPATGSNRARQESAMEPEHPPGEETSLRKIMLLLRNHCGVDFSLYKSPTIQRRLGRRMVLNQMHSLADYASFLQGNAKELDALYSDVLISVTSFFRNPEAFEALKEKVFPELLRQREPDETIRVWTIGCSTGQEAYSIAIAYAEFAGDLPAAPKLQVFATDLNEALLDKARRGLYGPDLAEDVSPERLKRFFVEEEGGYRVVKSLRDMCVFARQNILGDPPLSRMDLITCRNLLIYIDPALQRKILPNFHYALNPKGFLFLGASESIGSYTYLFGTVDKKERIFSKKPTTSRVYSLPALGNSTQQKLPPAAKRPGLPEAYKPDTNAQHEADRLLAARFAPPGVLVTAELEILQFRGAVEPYLKLPAGKPSNDLLKLARPELVLPVRALMAEARKENKPARRENIRMESAGVARNVNIEILPLTHLSEANFLVLFEELSRKPQPAVSGTSSAPRRAEKPAAQGKPQPARVAELEHELHDTRDYLQAVKDDAQAATEELQASSEELQSANEELQSINEELETSKEELESTNEELSTVNEELLIRNTELNRLNSDLNNLHLSINTPILVLSRELKVRSFTPMAEKIFNLLATDIDRPLGHIRHNLRFADLERFVAEVISSLALRELEVQDKEGRWFLLRARPYITIDRKIDGAVLVLTDIDALKRTEQAYRRSETRYRRLFETSQDGILILDAANGKIMEANPFVLDFLGYSSQELIGRELYEIGLLEDQNASKAAFAKLKQTGTIRYENLPIVTKRGERRAVEFVSSMHCDNEQEVIQCNIRDITERTSIQRAKFFLAAIVESSEDSIISIDFDQTITTWNKGAEHIYGYPAREVIGKSLAVLTLPDDLKVIPESIGRIRETEASETFDVERRQKNGELMYVSVTLSVIRDAHGQPIGISTISRDITKRKQSELDLAQAKALLHERAAQLEEIVESRTSQLRETIGELEKFSYSMVHDMRAPLRGMQGFARMLLEEHADRLDQHGLDYLRRIESSAKRLDRLIQDVLSYSRVVSGAPPLRGVDLDTLVRDILATYPDWQPPQSEIEITGTLPPVRGNEAFLTQCISNLVGNAVKFVARGTVPRVHISAEDIGSEVRIWVEDNGIGIAPKDQDRIFGMFDRIHAQSEYEGTGIGLAIVRKAVQQMGGQMGLVSELGQGSKFWFQLKKA